MATNTILQSLNDSAAAAGLTSSNRRQVETFIASAAIAEGDAVALDFSKTDNSDKALFVVSADTGAATSKGFVGVALEAATGAGEPIKVVISGLVVANLASGGATAGVNLMISTGGDFVDYADNSVLQNAGITCEARGATTAGKALVYVFKQF